MSESESCCFPCSNFWEEYKFHIISKGSIAVSILSSTFTFLDVYFPHLSLAKYISLAFLNVGIIMSGYAYGKIELKAELLDSENKSLQNDKKEMMKRLTTYQFPTSNQNTERTEPTSTALPTPFNADNYLNNSNILNTG